MSEPNPDAAKPPGAAPTQGLRLDDPEELQARLDLIVDYRGDATITRRSDPQPVVGYVFDGSNGNVRVMPQDGGAAVSIPLDDVTAIELTGRDTAAGKSFDTWVRKYIEKKRAGEVASIESEDLGVIQPHHVICASC